MSSVRMCDNPNCGEIFSEAEEGWSTAVQAQVKRDDKGNLRSVQVNIDLCPDCAGDTEEVGKKLAAARRQRRIQRLELEAGISGDPIERELNKEDAKQNTRAGY